MKTWRSIHHRRGSTHWQPRNLAVMAGALALFLNIMPIAKPVSAAGETAAAAQSGPLNDLPGRWSGWGAITLPSGQSEQVKCIATYFVRNGGTRIDQNLRCASASYRIDAVAGFDISGDTVKGHWEERANVAQGSVSGRMTPSGFNLAIRGDSFTAAMSVATSRCKQSINISPEGLEIRRIAIALDKC
ncbi:MAG: hypothetical protein AB7E80_05735 [Hyphomicrobiaceae bacterium]